ncbi:10367_t:CDS:2 [Funneliformis geosporum]|nr:10367_t:CDS:2 [Funneliformis geosporum]
MGKSDENTDEETKVGGNASKSKTEKELIEQNREIEEKRRRLSNENKGLKIKVEELEKKVGKLNLENGTLKSTLSVIKSQILQLDVKIDGEYETRIEVLPKE